MRDEFTKLMDRWQAKTGETMPRSISRLPLDRIRRAVDLTEKGITVVVPKEPVRVAEANGESMMAWDKRGEF